jgi:hypothetical protein
MARIDWIEHRLLNWQRWKLGAGGGGLGFARVNLLAVHMGRDSYTEARIPINDVEASETDQAVDRLPGELKATVIEAYLGEGGEQDHCRRLYCAKATLHARIGRAHRLLADHFSARTDRERQERQRVEAVIDAARPAQDVCIAPIKRARRRGSFTP